ncbi:uncharacterized protein METZ01_LOCUS314992, partial [marine metagenome]
ISHDTNHSFTALNRLLAAGASVRWVHNKITLDGVDAIDRGAMLINGVERHVVNDLAEVLELDILATNLSDEIPALTIRAPRLAIFEPWGGNIDAGWTRWVLDQHDFSYTRVRSRDIRAANLHERFDVIILPEMSSSTLIQGLQGPNVRPAYRGGIAAQGVRNLRRFVNNGGTLITLGNAATFAIEHLAVPITNVVSGQPEEAFYCPGSILRVSIDTSHPIGYGMPSEADAMLVGNGGYRISRARRGVDVRTIAQYPNLPLLRSGLLVGEEHIRGTSAIMEAPLGKGRIILHTFRVQHRGQTWGTFKLLFNSIFYGPAISRQSPVQTSLDAH